MSIAPTHPPLKRLTSLDALRGVAALSVVLWHWKHFFAIDGPWTSWSNEAQPFFAVLKPFYLKGWAAVDLFFVLSGFVFFWLYRDSIRTRKAGAARFALLRFSRLYPLHLVTLLAAAFLQFVYRNNHAQTFVYQGNDGPHFVAHLFFVQDWWPDAPQCFNGPTWSVSIEVLLYVLFFVACRAGLRRGWQCLLIALFGIVVRMFDEHMARGILSFFMGGFAFSLWDSLRNHPRAATIARGLGVAAIGGWAALWTTIYRGDTWLNSSEGNNLFLLLFDGVLAPLTVLVLALREHVHRRSSAWMGHLGDISYSTYLLHFPMQLALALVAGRFALRPEFFMQRWVMIVFYLVLIGLGTASYHLFEKRIQHWIRGRSSRT